jgi:hypothetical protein
MCSCETAVPLALHIAPTEKRCPLCPDEPIAGSCDREREAPCSDTAPVTRLPLIVMGGHGVTGAAGGVDLASVGVSLCLLGLGRTAEPVDMDSMSDGRVVEGWLDAPDSRSLCVPAPPPRA